MKCHSSKSYLRRVAILVILICAIIIPAVSALSVGGGKIMTEVQPGITFTHPMTVAIGSDESATDIAVDILGFGQLSDGSYKGLQPADDTSPLSARTFVSVDTPVIHLNPGETRPFNVTVRVPANAGTGGRYAIILVHSAPKPSTLAGGTAGVATGIMYPVILTISGTNLTYTGSITDLQAGQVVKGVQGSSVPILTTLQNTGNIHYYGAFVNVTITDSSGKLVATGSTDPSVYALLPGNKMTMTTYITTPLSTGTYTAKADAKLSQGMVLLDSKTASITIGMAVQPPQTPATEGTQPPAGTTATPSGTSETHKLWILPIYVPGPDALITVGVLSAAILLWSRGRRR